MPKYLNTPKTGKESRQCSIIIFAVPLLHPKGNIENAFADNLYERSELDYLIYNDSAAYAELILNGDAGRYLKAVTVYKTDEILS